MLEKLPKYYQKSTVVKDIYNSIEDVINDAASTASTNQENLYLQTASDLTRFEEETGVDHMSDTTVEKSKILSHLQGGATCTLKVLKGILDNYNIGNYTVVQDYANYTITVIFNEYMGEPTNIVQLKKEINSVLPAHLKMIYQYLFNTFISFTDKLTTGSDSIWKDIPDTVTTWVNMAEYK